jgi:hypothetical protein
VSHGRYVAFQIAEVAIPRQMFQEILRLIAELRRSQPQRWRKTFDGRAFKANTPEECIPMSGKRQMRPSNAVRTVWDAEAIGTSHPGFGPIQKIATIHASSAFIRGIPTDAVASAPACQEL